MPVARNIVFAISVGLRACVGGDGRRGGPVRRGRRRAGGHPVHARAECGWERYLRPHCALSTFSSSFLFFFLNFDFPDCVASCPSFFLSFAGLWIRITGETREWRVFSGVSTARRVTKTYKLYKSASVKIQTFKTAIERRMSYYMWITSFRQHKRNVGKIRVHPQKSLCKSDPS
ncbi:hypothetical protein EDB89DRAFT_126825 [Lactarius sanguifluus]|nr:hypothetical protein EDB89DRAFT_126825 [Lactarius sanguifluus]